MKFVRTHILSIVGIIVGSLIGYLYYYYIGCESGSCSITSSPINSSIYGAAMGGLVLSLFKKEATEKTEA
jgi:hypothetical protein